ncbi:MAG TPA: hypothetical protein PK359_04400 [Burkholderiaceae bacterium]|jgi:photosystem II stability/assembly factor-like uncharacterized protein|nr:hypothetical protein [Burkholderiaceae bacterium]
MGILAGTSRGLYRIDESAATKVLDKPLVRDLTAMGDWLFAGSSEGLFVSTDQGASWSPAGLEGLAVWQVRGSADGRVLYAGVEPAALYRSNDGGERWTEIESFSRLPEAAKWCVPLTPPLPGRARAIVVDQTNPDRIWVGVEVGGMLRSEDGGASWQLNLPGDNPDIHMLSAHPTDTNVLFVSTGYGRPDGVAEMIEGNAGVFRSDDGGASWQYAWHGITPRYSRPMCIDPRPPYGLTVASAPTAFSNVREAGGAKAMLFRSDDGGGSWRSLCDPAHSPSAANFHGLTHDPSEPGAVIVGNDSGEVWQVSAQGAWRKCADGLPTVLSLLAA